VVDDDDGVELDVVVVGFVVVVVVGLGFGFAVVVVLLEVVDEVDDVVVVGFMSSSLGATNCPVSRSRTAKAMNRCQILVGNVPPATWMPCTFVILRFVPSG
jgi:hypothetical protein